ncbi:MAG: hypothetical protein JW709_06860 [Sedimentisphaerales bacterium]|nr:hypothetical protein [Sedimentisphaerales bacterium]
MTRLLTGLMLIVLLGTGCSRGIKEGLYAVTGSSGKIVRLSGDETRIGNLANEYGGVRVELFANDVGQAAPQSFIDALPGAIAKRLEYRSRSLGEKIKGVDKEEAGPFFTGPAGKVLVIRGRVIQYEAGDLTDKAISPMDEAICRVQFTDGTTGEMLAEANCTGRSKSVVRTGPDELADGVAKAINKFLKPHDEEKN